MGELLFNTCKQIYIHQNKSRPAFFFFINFFTCSYRRLFDRDVVDVQSINGLSGSEQQHTQVIAQYYSGVVKYILFSE